MGILKQIILNADIFLGTMPLVVDAYIQNKTGSGAGVYSCEDWKQYRIQGHTQAGKDLQSLSSNELYLSRCFGGEFRKFLAGMRLLNRQDFSGIRSVLELGCGEVMTSFAIANALPEVRIVALDYDDILLGKLNRLSILDRIEKKAIDLAHLTEDELAQFDLVFSIDLFYSLSSEQIMRLFALVEKSGTSMIVGSSQIVGPLKALIFWAKNIIKACLGSSYRSMEEKGLLRRHGWKRSLGEYRRLASLSGLEMTVVSMPPLAFSYGDTYTLMRIQRKGARRRDS